MFDLSKMDQAFTAMGELDALLKSIRDEQRVTNVLLAMQISDAYATRTGHPADVPGVLAQVAAIANGPDVKW